MSTQITEVYKVDRNSDTQVELEVLIGNEQLGITFAHLGDQKIISGVKGKIRHKIGTGSEIDGKKLFITTMVKDKQTATNKTEVTFKLKGGISNYKEILKKEVSVEGGVVFYVAYFTFYS